MIATRTLAPKVFLKFFKSELYKLLTSFTALWLLLATLAVPVLLAFAYSGLIVASGSTLNRKSFFESIAISYIPIVVTLCLLSLTTFSQDYLGPGRDRLRIQANQFGQIFLVKTLINVVVVFLFSSLGYLAAFLFLYQSFDQSILRYKVNPATALAYLAANEAPIVVIAFIATLISVLSSSYFQGLLHLFLMLLVLPAALGTLSVDGHFNLAWLTPLSSLQAISTFPGASPFTIQGLAPSNLTQSESSLVLLLWLLAYGLICWLVCGIWPKKQESQNRFSSIEKLIKPRFFEAQSSKYSAQGKFARALQSSVHNLFSDSATNRAVVAWLIVSFGLALLAYQRLSGQNFGLPARLSELAFQSQLLGSTTQMESLFLAFLGVSLISRESSPHTIQVQLLAVPSRKIWLWSKVSAYFVYFFAISLATFFLQLLVSTNLFQKVAVVGLQGLQMYLWFAVHCLFFGTGAGLLGVLFGLLIRSSLSSFLVVGSVFIIVPSLLSGFNQPLANMGMPGVANLLYIFPFAALGVHWLLPNSWMPQFIVDGRILLNSDQEVLVFLGWLVLLLVGAYIKNRKISL